MLSHSVDFPTDKIWVNREARQRSKIEIDDLIPSIKKRGILQPLLIHASGEIIFGERRWTTAKHLSLETVPVRIAEELSVMEAELIELDENRRRKNLTWQDEVKAIARLHAAYASEDPNWTEAKTAGVLDITIGWLNRVLPVGEAILGGDESLANLDTLSAAVTTQTRRRARATDSVLNALSEDFELEDDDSIDAMVELELDDDDFDPDTPGEWSDQNFEDAAIVVGGTTVKPATGTLAKPSRQKPEPAEAPAAFRILHGDMSELLPQWSGPKFNLLHLDLPYGVKLNAQANQSAFEGGGYDSDPEIYWKLLNVIADNWSKFMSPSSHFMCWISMEFYTETIEFLENRIPGLWICKSPLIWHKSDNKGILSDPKRRARVIYEACLYGSTGDRMIVKPVSNVYAAPTNKKDSIHTNEKPIPMLEHFMRMFTDHHSRVLDPTAGSGSAIRASEKLGAEYGLGFEFNEDFAARAQGRLLLERNMAKLSEKAKGKSDDEPDGD